MRQKRRDERGSERGRRSEQKRRRRKRDRRKDIRIRWKRRRTMTTLATPWRGRRRPGGGQEVERRKRRQEVGNGPSVCPEVLHNQVRGVRWAGK